MNHEVKVALTTLAHHMPWDPTIPGLVVRCVRTPGRHGTTTGRTKQAGSFLLAEVDFGPMAKEYKPVEQLEPVAPPPDMARLRAAGQWGGPTELRRVLLAEKIQGALTSMVYARAAAHTHFYPHQFKPVLQFLQSPVGRLLLADEVGLGKTIEAGYIWQELQAREAARRLLIVCPAALCHQWRTALWHHFRLPAQVVSARELVAQDRHAPCTSIASLEGLRPPATSARQTRPSGAAQLARLCAQHTAPADPLFDLAIIDEAHHLRHPSTANHRLGELLRDASRYLLLLTATPVHLASDDLYHLLRLLDPDQFPNPAVFQETLRANTPVVRALRHLWAHPPDLPAVAQALAEARASAYFATDPVLARVHAQVGPALATDLPQRVALGRLLASRSLLGQSSCAAASGMSCRTASHGRPRSCG